MPTPQPTVSDEGLLVAEALLEKYTIGESNLDPHEGMLETATAEEIAAVVDKALYLSPTKPPATCFLDAKQLNWELCGWLGWTDMRDGQHEINQRWWDGKPTGMPPGADPKKPFLVSLPSHTEGERAGFHTAEALRYFYKQGYSRSRIARELSEVTGRPAWACFDATPLEMVVAILRIVKPNLFWS